ncbi:MAG: hypothetical protein MRJ93_12910 [Nitrososphaeraceae archaeon]|nr:hypothetical protein [Nitrososphaeraceae archaeon]
MSINNAINPHSNDTNNAIDDDLDTNHKEQLDNTVSNNDKIIKDKMNAIRIVASATDKEEDDVRFNPEIIDVNLTLSENVYQVARLICQMEYDLNWDQYVSALVRQDAFSLRGGDRNILKDYAERMLESDDGSPTLADY